MIAIWIMDQKLIKIFIFILSFSFVQPQSAKLIWSDEFNGDGSVNSSNWFHQTKLPNGWSWYCLLYTSPSPRDATLSRMPSSA